MSDRPSDRHNSRIKPMLELLCRDSTEAESWVLLETMALALGELHKRNSRQVAVFIETMADRIVTGERQ